MRRIIIAVFGMSVLLFGFAIQSKATPTYYTFTTTDYSFREGSIDVSPLGNSPSNYLGLEYVIMIDRDRTSGYTDLTTGVDSITPDATWSSLWNMDYFYAESVSKDHIFFENELNPDVNFFYYGYTKTYKNDDGTLRDKRELMNVSNNDFDGHLQLNSKEYALNEDSYDIGSNWYLFDGSLSVDNLSIMVEFNAVITQISEYPPAPVPEPATMMLFGIGLLGLAGVSRKQSVGRM